MKIIAFVLLLCATVCGEGSLIAVGSAATATSGNLTLDLPDTMFGAAIAPTTNDIWIAWVITKGSSAATVPSGWTTIVSGRGGMGGTETNLMSGQLCYIRYSGSTPDMVFLNVPNAEILGNIVAVRGCKATGSPVEWVSLICSDTANFVGQSQRHIQYFDTIGFGAADRAVIMVCGAIATGDNSIPFDMWDQTDGLWLNSEQVWGYPNAEVATFENRFDNGTTELAIELGFCPSGSSRSTPVVWDDGTTNGTPGTCIHNSGYEWWPKYFELLKGADLVSPNNQAHGNIFVSLLAEPTAVLTMKGAVTVNGAVTFK